jgi:hypothetical protein
MFIKKLFGNSSESGRHTICITKRNDYSIRSKPLLQSDRSQTRSKSIICQRKRSALFKEIRHNLLIHAKIHGIHDRQELNF